MLAAGLGWRGTYGVQAAVQGAVAVLLALTWRAWDRPAPTAPAPTAPAPTAPAPTAPAPTAPAPTALSPPTPSDPLAPRAPIAPQLRAGALFVLLAAAFAAIECGIESGAGVWVATRSAPPARGLSGPVAAGTVSAYWAMMFAARGPSSAQWPSALVPAATCTGGVAGLVAGAALLTVPGPAVVPVAGLALVGLAAAPIFPLLTLATAERTGAADATWAISLQVAASAGGNAALPAGLGLGHRGADRQRPRPGPAAAQPAAGRCTGGSGRRTGEAGGPRPHQALAWTNRDDHDTQGM